MTHLVGRRVECEAVEGLLTQAQAGNSGALVVRGEAGIGKTSLLEHLNTAAVATGFRVETVAGVETETQFAFAALHQLCGPLLDRASALPDPQQDALSVAFGLRSGTAPDRFLVGLATLNLLAEVAEEKPVLCLVDDAQWLDQASTEVLTFVARRVAAEQVLLVFALREAGDGGPDPFAGLAEQPLRGLGEIDARALLGSAVALPLDDGVRDRIIDEARGNPLALLELPWSVRPAALAGGFELPDVRSIPRRVEDTFRRRSADLPAETQLLLLVAAAEPTGEVALLWRALAELGIGAEAAEPAEAAGLLQIAGRVRFRHPLVRSAVYQAARPPERRRVHQALAGATDPRLDPDRRAWHRARAVAGTDEDAAAELERSAGRARARGGLAAGAAFLQHAAELTPDPARHAARALEAAHAQHEAGASEGALRLAGLAAGGPLDALQRARLDRLRADIAFNLERGSDVPGRLLQAAEALAPLDAALSRDTYLHALDSAIIIGGVEQVRGMLAGVDLARVRSPHPGTPGPADLLLDGLVTAFVRGYEAGVPGLRRALEAFSRSEAGPGVSDDGDSRWLWLASRLTAAILDDELLHVLAGRSLARAREAGALTTLPGALLVRSFELVFCGELAEADELAAEASRLARATGAVPWRWGWPFVAGWRGNQDEIAGLLTASEQVTGRSEASLIQYALAVLWNGLGHYPAAVEAAAQASTSGELLHPGVALPELVEAACRAGQPERAAVALEQLSSRARASGTAWALGVAARSRALTSSGTAAEAHYREALDRLGSCRMAGYLARTHLVYGEWLRREGRRSDARDQLRDAHQMLSEMGMEAFAARAARELRATGEHPRKRTARPSDALTAHELHIARLVATGATSREVGAQLYLSPRTIDAHLRTIFTKLGITSRRQLRELQLR